MINSHVFVVGKTPFFNSQHFNYVSDVHSEFLRSAFENPRGFEKGRRPVLSCLEIKFVDGQDGRQAETGSSVV